MAVKTITIDMEAYEILSSEKKENESFSKVIKRHFKNKSNAQHLLSNLNKCTLSDETLSNIEEVIKSRTNSIINSPILDKD